jgi:hypothetical protein
LLVRPATQGQRWSDAEDQHLRRFIAGNLDLSWSDVAEQLAGLSLVSRRPKAVEKRLCRLQRGE